MGEVRVSLIALVLLFASPAFAQDDAPTGYAAQIEDAKAKILAKDWKGAKAALDAAEAAAPANELLIQEKDLARLFFYRGLVEWRAGDKDKAALDWWRQTIALAPGYEPDAEVLPETDGQDVYYALMGEVKAQEQVTLNLPEDPGDVVLFVDGRRMEAFDAVTVGKHFVQMRCGEGNVVGSWWTFGPPPPDYLSLCSGTPYPEQKAAKGGGKAPKGKDQVSKKAQKEAEKAEKERLAIEAAASAAVARERELAQQKEIAKEAITAKEQADQAARKAESVDAGEAEKAAAEKARQDAEKAEQERVAKEKALAEEKAKAEADAKAKADAEAKAKADADAKATAEADAKAKADADAKAKADADAKAKADPDAKAEADAKAKADKEAEAKAKAEADAKAKADKEAEAKARAEADAKAKAEADAKAKAEADAKAKAEADAKAKADKEKAVADAHEDKADHGGTKSEAHVDKKGGGGTVGWVMIAGGGAMLLGGGAVNFLVVNPTYDKIDSANTPGSYVDQTTADQLVQTFNTGRYATIGLVAAGAATLATGVVLGPLDAHVWIAPQGLGISGSW